jgi:hypothetical protein
MAIDWGMPWSWAEVSVPIGVPGSGERKVLWIECFESESIQAHINRMEEVAHKAGAGIIIADLGFGQAQNEGLREKFPHEFWTIFTNDAAKFDPLIDAKEQHVNWGKVRCAKSHFGMLRQKKVHLPKDSPMIHYSAREAKPAHVLWMEHHKAVSIRVDGSDQDKSKLVDQERGLDPREIFVANGPCHLFMVSAYADTVYRYVARQERWKEWKHRRHRGRVKIAVAGGRRR